MLLREIATCKFKRSFLYRMIVFVCCIKFHFLKKTIKTRKITKVLDLIEKIALVDMFLILIYKTE